MTAQYADCLMRPRRQRSDLLRIDGEMRADLHGQAACWLAFRRSEWNDIIDTLTIFAVRC
jgi:hypothetical protein